MNPWFAKVVVQAAVLAIVAIRAPHGARNRRVTVAESRKGSLETWLLAGAWVGVILPIVWVWTPLFAFADFALQPTAFAGGVTVLVFSLWLFWRSHADLGTNWSITLEIRDTHQLVTNGVYRYVRHPMYAALLLYGLGEALIIPNWLVAPFYLFAMALVSACRFRPEEQLMKDRFPGEYDAYAARTNRLIPGIW
jgi:protein-S-isoprenylcysteine O-methyltransferase Ste14